MCPLRKVDIRKYHFSDSRYQIPILKNSSHYPDRVFQELELNERCYCWMHDIAVISIEHIKATLSIFPKILMRKTTI